MKKIQWSIQATVLGLMALLFTVGIFGEAFAAEAKPLVLRWALYEGAQTLQAKYLQKAADEVAKATEGRVKINMFWSESLIKVKEMPKAIEVGLCDIAWVTPSYHPAEIPLHSVVRVLLFHPHADDAGYLTKKAWELDNKSKEWQAENEKMKQVAWFNTPFDANLLYSKKPVKTLADLKGMRVRVVGDEPIKAFKAVGAHPTFISASETYDALDKGIVDAAVTSADGGKKFSYYEVAPYLIDIGLSFSVPFYNVSQAALKKMSDKDRKAFMEIGRNISIQAAVDKSDERAGYIKFMTGKGMKQQPWPAAERKAWESKPEVKAFVKEWIDKQNAAKRPGTKVMKDFLTVFEVPEMMPAGY